jgi:hypothetical protein
MYFRSPPVGDKYLVGGARRFSTWRWPQALMQWGCYDSMVFYDPMEE